MARSLPQEISNRVETILVLLTTIGLVIIALSVISMAFVKYDSNSGYLLNAIFYIGIWIFGFGLCGFVLGIGLFEEGSSENDASEQLQEKQSKCKRLLCTRIILICQYRMRLYLNQHRRI